MKKALAGVILAVACLPGQLASLAWCKRFKTLSQKASLYANKNTLVL